MMHVEIIERHESASCVVCGGRVMARALDIYEHATRTTVPIKNTVQ